MTNLMVVSLKTDSKPSIREDITKQVLSDGGNDARGSLHPKFEICRNTSMVWHDWCM